MKCSAAGITSAWRTVITVRRSRGLRARRCGKTSRCCIVGMTPSTTLLPRCGSSSMSWRRIARRSRVKGRHGDRRQGEGQQRNSGGRREDFRAALRLEASMKNGGCSTAAGGGGFAGRGLKILADSHLCVLNRLVFAVFDLGGGRGVGVGDHVNRRGAAGDG